MGLARNERFFLGPVPAFELSFCGLGVFAVLESLGEYEHDRQARSSVKTARTGLVLRDSTAQVICMSHVVGTVRTEENVDVERHERYCTDIL